MGKKEKKAVRVVLDTNVVISAILFKGELSKLLDFWKSGKISPVLSRGTFGELRQALEYPKFALTKTEIKKILEEEVLPYFSVVEEGIVVKGV